MTKFISIEAALAKFEEAAANHAIATEQGDFKAANKNYSVIAKVIAFLREKNEMPSLLRFLSHSSSGVKAWSATFLLPLEEQKAVQALEDISKEGGIRSLAAETTLSEWRKGNLKL